MLWCKDYAKTIWIEWNGVQIYIFQLPPAISILSTENKLNSVKYDIYAMYDKYTIGLTIDISWTFLPPHVFLIETK